MSADYANGNGSESPPDPTDEIRENKDLFKRLAESDLPIADDCRRALELIEAAEGDDDADNEDEDDEE